VRGIARDSHILIVWRLETDSEFSYGITFSLSFPVAGFSYSLNAALSGRGPMPYQETSNSLPAVRLNA
jgi:hypothetical protein